jgi:uncharacterized protein YndB with AHSA1/START domain
MSAPCALAAPGICREELCRTGTGWSSRGGSAVGGGFRFVLEDPKGRRMGMRVVYEELAPPERSVHIESFDDFPGPEARVTTLFDERDGTTTMTVTVLAASKEIRDTVVASGMEHGAAETYGRLAALLEAQTIG